LASPAEARLVNAVARKLAAGLAADPVPRAERVVPDALRRGLSQYYSHPDWLVRRWIALFGGPSTQALLEWNQTPPSVHARWRGMPGQSGAGGGASPPDWLKPTPWPGFFEIPSHRWPDVERLLADGLVFLQDPGTRIAVALLDPKPGESWLDACAAPGGKSVLIADLAGSGRLVAGDVEGGPRFGHLEENLGRVRGVEARAVALDLLAGPKAALEAAGLPAAYDAVLVDVPCSNTGVMRHRVDVKWRLQEGDFAKHARQQRALLAAAAALVAPGGRLVYSTCSIDPEENEAVPEAFLRGRPDFTLEAKATCYPWEAGHDGVGAFRLRKA
jgi:16S rRNA (cytosine967-C5)-methyltransferase